ncbi:putative adenine-specific methylase [Serratia phage vB_SmaM-Susuwatari]|nr:putative adenine-specific methylase [Serratia phage vB_SmaM-Susuwatari]
MKQAEDQTTIDAFAAPTVASHYQALAPCTLNRVSGKRWLGSETPDDVRSKQRTPKWLFNVLNKRYGGPDGFNLDAAADAENSHCIAHYNEEQNSLLQEWASYEYVFCNPPFDDLNPWVEKAIAECKLGKNVTVAMILPHDVSVAWAHRAIINSAEIIHVISDGKASGRVAFIDPISKKPRKKNNKGTMICIFKSKKKMCKTLYLSRTALEVEGGGEY